MKTTYFFLLTMCAATSAYAVPVLDDSSYNDDLYASRSTVRSAASATSSSSTPITKLQKEVAQLKTKVNALEREVYAGKYYAKDLDYNRNYNPTQSKGVGTSRSFDDHEIANELPGEKNRYARAYNIFRDGYYDDAIAEFQAIINTYPEGEYADNSQYWIGEALLKKGNKQSAMKAFDRVIRVYPRSPKVPDALLKLGMTMYSMGNREKAKEYYDYLIETYPGTPSAVKAYDKKLQAGL